MTGAARLTHTVDPDEWDDDDGEIPKPVKRAPEPTWHRITRERYDDKRSQTFPPSTLESGQEGMYRDSAFLDDHPVSHNSEGRPLYCALLSRTYEGLTNYFECDAPVSVAEFQSLDFMSVAHPQPDDAEPAPAAE